MKIVLDANAYRGDLWQKDEKINLLLEYARRTEGSVIAPEVVLSEVDAAIERLWTNELSALQRIRNFLAQGAGVELDTSSIKKTPRELTDAYMARLKKRFRLDGSRIVKVDGAHLPDLVHRAATRKRPFDENGEGFRDALIWLCIMQLGAKEPVALISRDKDFGVAGVLHRELLEEAAAKGIKVLLYASIDGFLKEHQERIAFITTEFVEALIDKADLENEVLKQAQSRTYRRRRESLLARRYIDEVEDAEATDVNLWLDDYYVYRTSDEDITIMAFYRGDLDLEGHGYGFNEDRPYLSERHQPYDDGHHSIQATPEINVHVEIKLHGRTLDSWAVTEIDF
jgi:hypothetical protein